MDHKILAVGLDPMLLKSRALILTSRRYRCGCALPAEALERLRHEQFSLLLVCSSLSTETASQLIQDIRKEHADLEIVRLVAPGARAIQEPVANTIVDVDFHPQTWIEAVERLAADHGQSDG